MNWACGPLRVTDAFEVTAFDDLLVVVALGSQDACALLGDCRAGTGRGFLAQGVRPSETFGDEGHDEGVDVGTATHEARDDGLALVVAPDALSIPVAVWGISDLGTAFGATHQ
ncbi:hypothetical protein [Gulosibacter bifidus]|uniref:Uncharacterized protein n=1 Tax=Gulosibacter bifidus TaxID=272239 RepID=A0ABW5RH73_9MICO|nr:hypothetical protein [Gulosibacter bifidus]